jgi:hypothetical protein
LALLAETLVEEWLNRQGFLTVRGVRDGVNEMDILAVRLRHSEGQEPEAWHVEVQSSFRPMNYLTPLPKSVQAKTGKGAGAAISRTPEMVRECVAAWIEKKYEKPKMVKHRDFFCSGANWKRVLVHAVVKHEEELAEFRLQGIKLVRLDSVLEALCPPTRPAFTASAGTDIADLIEYYGRVRQLPIDDETEGDDEDIEGEDH